MSSPGLRNLANKVVHNGAVVPLCAVSRFLRTLLYISRRTEPINVMLKRRDQQETKTHIKMPGRIDESRDLAWRYSEPNAAVQAIEVIKQELSYCRGWPTVREQYDFVYIGFA